MKRRSPSAGALREGLDPGLLARTYVDAGAAAVSVLTEGPRFGGSLRDLEAVASAVRVPVLRKDFVTTPAQVSETREAGATAVLLIARLLEPALLAELAAHARGSGLTPLVEIRDPAEMEAALAAGADVVGVNNRDLQTLRTDPEHSLRVASEIGPGTGTRAPLLVSESGIGTREQVLALAGAGYRAVLVGESLLRAPDPGRALRALLGRAGKGRQTAAAGAAASRAAEPVRPGCA